LEAIVMSPTAAAAAIAGRVRGRHSTAQNRTGSDGKQHQGHGEEGAQFHRLDVAGARVEYEQGAARRNDHSGQRERQGRVSQRQIAHDLRDKARQNLHVPAVRAPAPGMLDSLDEELEVVVAEDGAPRRAPGNPQQHRY
jgi:hypothetical protein